MGRKSLILLFLSLFLFLPGCYLQAVRMYLPGFNDGDVDGVWLWKLNENSNTYERLCRFDFSDPVDGSVRETIFYSQHCLYSHRSGTVKARVIRDPDNPGNIYLTVFYAMFRFSITDGIYFNRDNGEYKATAFNSFGESDLSTNSIVLEDDGSPHYR